MEEYRKYRLNHAHHVPKIEHGHGVSGLDMAHIHKKYRMNHQMYTGSVDCNFDDIDHMDRPLPAHQIDRDML